MENNNNKKTLILSIIGILVLVIAVVGVSFAMYSFTGTGTKTNVIQTGTVTFDVDTESEDSSFTLDTTSPMTDEKGIEATDNDATITIDAGQSYTAMTIKYDLGIEILSEGTTLKAEHIKVALLDGNNNVVVGGEEGTTNLTSGVTIASLANTAGPNNLITSYGLTGGTVSAETTTYTIKAWVSDQYNLDSKISAENTTADQDATGTLDDQNGTLHQKETAADTFKFRVIIKAVQA